MKLMDTAKIKDVGIGKVVRVYDNGEYVVIEICGQKYYRDLKTDNDIEISNKEEYIQFLKFMLKELTVTSKNKRAEASEYNKEVGGLATKRKGKVSVINGNICGLNENSISLHHRGLLQDAKKAKELKEKIKKEIEIQKEWLKVEK